MSDTPLFERLGGREGVAAVVEKAIANHLTNPTICTRFQHAATPIEDLTASATEFFCSGLSGIDTYTGKSMAEVHAGMNITEEEFLATVDDILAAMDDVGAPDLEKAEVLGILYGMKNDVIRK